MPTRGRSRRQRALRGAGRAREVLSQERLVRAAPCLGGGSVLRDVFGALANVSALTLSLMLILLMWSLPHVGRADGADVGGGLQFQFHRFFKKLPSTAASVGAAVGTGVGGATLGALVGEAVGSAPSTTPARVQLGTCFCRSCPT